ncbi:MAG: AmmeMemoRadiSam system radical SAM enzyme [bacterium]|nr:AmmeMemoRadiSam system radical SAM enzyme [bacterium]
MHEAQFYKKSANQTVACELCNHFCHIKNNAVGICGVRKNLDGKLISLVYGYPAAINIDPIEKKPLFHFLPGSKTFSLGTLGCNFKCANCQNWGISQAKAIDSLSFPRRQPVFFFCAEVSTEEQSRQDEREKNNKFWIPAYAGMTNKKIQSQTKEIIQPSYIVERALKSGCRSIAYTYNEPTVFAEYALDIMKLAKKNNLKNIWVSNGYMSKSCLEAIIPYLDAINVDLKSMDENFYRKNCGAKLKPILKNLMAIKKSGVHLEITTLIIPKLSDDPARLKKIAKFIVHELGAEVPWHLSRFSPDVSWKLKNTPATPEKTILEAYELGKKAGLKYVYVGNVHSIDKENTYCPNCGQLAIKRVGYHITRHDDNGHCPKCGYDLCVIV